MSNIQFKVALNNAQFPLYFPGSGAEVLDPGLDVASRANPAFAGKTENLDWNMIQVKYVQNMLPTSKGYKSVIWRPRDTFHTENPFVTNVDVLTAETISFDDGVVKTFMFGVDFGGLGSLRIYQFYPEVAESIQYRFPTTFNSSAELSLSTVGGIYYVGGVDSLGNFEVAKLPDSSTVVAATFTYPAGITAADVKGMCSSGNYNIIHTGVEILWSVPGTPEDFATTTLGAGRQIPADLRGVIKRIMPISGGFVIYTDRMAVAALATYNPATPFRFVPIRGSSGLSNFYCIAGNANSTVHYVSAPACIQAVTVSAAENVFAEILEYAANNRTFNVTMAAGTGPSLPPAEVIARLVLSEERYLIFILKQAGYSSSANTPPVNVFYQDICVLDLAHNRWTRFRPPVDLIAVAPSVPTSVHSAASSWMGSGLWFPSVIFPEGFTYQLQTATELSGDQSAAEALSFFIAGSIQARRGRTVTLNCVEIYGMRNPKNYNPAAGYIFSGVTVSILNHDTGVYTPMTEVGDSTAGIYWRFDGRITGERLSVKVAGNLEVSAVICTVTLHGIR